MTKTRLALWSMAALAASGATSAQADLVRATFDSMGGPGEIRFVDAEAYRSWGLVFDRDIPVGDVFDLDTSKYSEFLELGGTDPYGMALTEQWGTVIEGRFVDPVTLAPRTSDVLSMLFYDTNVGTNLGVLEAYDIHGDLISRISHVTPTALGQVFTVNGTGIHSFRISVDSDGSVVDNIQFLSVPAPGAVALLGMAGLVSGAGRRRRA